MKESQVGFVNSYLAFRCNFPSLFLCSTNGSRLDTTIMLPEDVITSAIFIVLLLLRLFSTFEDKEQWSKKLSKQMCKFELKQTVIFI